jgi:hypothetical protein
VPNFNEVIADPSKGFLADKITLNPSTLLEPPPQFETQKVNTMTVANGDTIQVYDVTDPSNPVLIGTVG